MKRIYTLAFLILLAFSMNAADYYTIKDGNWTNGTDLWSLDGTTACACNPGTNFSDRIFVRHDINMNADLTVAVGGDLNIESGARLYNGSYIVDNYGSITNDGTFGMDEFTNQAGASMINNGTMDVINGNLENYGFFNNAGPLTVVNGNLDCAPGSSMIVGASIRVQMPNGNVYNGGTMTFNGGGACIIIDNGNFYNEVTGETAGSGGINASGNVYNDGIWGAGIDWCAGGSGSGSQPLPAENCAAVCNAPLPVVLSNFDVRVVEGNALLTWTTVSEKQTDYFAIERKVAYADNEFIEIARIDAAGSSSALRNYEYRDLQLMGTSVEYRLRAVDLDGSYEYSKVVEIFLGTASSEIITYPNPATDVLNIRINSLGNENAEIALVDLTGRVVRKIDRTLTSGPQEFSFDLNGLENGAYVLQVRQGAAQKIQTVILSN